MKNLKLLYLVFLCLLNAMTVFSQKRTFIENEGELKEFEPHLRFEYGGNIGLASNKNFNYLIGAEAGLQYYFNKKSAATMAFGYNYAFDGKARNLGYIPLKTGYKYFIKTGKVYLLGEVGMGVSTTKGYNGVGFLLAPSVGYITQSAYDLSLRYENLSQFDSGQIIFRVAYSFKI